MPGSSLAAIVEWCRSLGVDSSILSADLESGQLVAAILDLMSPDSGIELDTGSPSMVARVNNWNTLTNQLRKFNIRLSQEDKNKIINGASDLVLNILTKLQETYLRNQKENEVDITKLDGKMDPKDANSLLELVILTIMRNFSLSPKESVALLSNEAKYLAHILAKGLKSEFKPILSFLEDLRASLGQLIQYSTKSRENENFLYKCIKPGLISKSEQVCLSCLSLLEILTTSLGRGYEILKQHLLSTILLMVRRHPHLIGQAVRSTLIMLRTSGSKKQLSNSSLAKSSVADLAPNPNFLALIKDQISGLELNFWYIQICSTAQEGSILTTDQLLAAGGFQSHFTSMLGAMAAATPQIYLSLLGCVATTVEINPSLLDARELCQQLLQSINSVGMTISKKVEVQQLNHLLFWLLCLLGRAKNPVAPALYRKLVERYQISLNEEESEMLALNFIDLFQVFPQVPQAPLLESINIRYETGTLILREIEFNLLQKMIDLPTFDSSSAAIVFNIVSRPCLEDLAHSSRSGQLLMEVCLKYPQFLKELILKLVKVALAVHFANCKKLYVAVKKKLYPNKLDAQDQAFRLRNLNIEVLLSQLIGRLQESIKSAIQPLLAYTYREVKHLSEALAENLYRILGKYGEVSAVLSKYEEHLREKQEGEEREKGRSRLKLSESEGIKKNSRYDGSRQEEQPTFEPLLLLSRKRGNSTYTVPPIDKVSTDAQKGLEKYHKAYLYRLEKEEVEKQRKIDDDERKSILKKVVERRLLQKGLAIKPEENIQLLFDYDSKQKQIQEERVRGKVELQLFDPETEEERDLKGLDYLMKKYSRAIKVYFINYTGNKQHHGTNRLFDEAAEKKQVIDIAMMYKILKDHHLDQFISIHHAKQLVKTLNYNQSKEKDKEFSDSLVLDLEGFEAFLIQVSFVMFTKPPKDLRGHPITEIVEELFRRLKAMAHENKVDPKIFQESDSYYYTETEAIRELNRKLQKNPSYIVPEGYKKITEKRVNFSYQIFLEAMSPVYKDTYQILDEILFNAFGFHIIEPFTTYQTISRARPTLYYLHRIDKSEYVPEPALAISYSLRKEVARLPIYDREVGKAVAECLHDIIEAVANGHDRTGLRLENRIKKQKKLREEEEKKKQEDLMKRREVRDKEIKEKLVAQRAAKEEKKQKEEEEKREQQRKEQAERRRKEEQEVSLKKKVEEYQQKKKAEEEQKAQDLKDKIQKSKEDYDRKKRENEEIKRKIDESKKAKEQEQQEKKAKEAQEAKKAKDEEKRKLQMKQKEVREKIELYKKNKTQNLVEPDSSPKHQ